MRVTSCTLTAKLLIVLHRASYICLGRPVQNGGALHVLDQQSQNHLDPTMTFQVLRSHYVMQ